VHEATFELRAKGGSWVPEEGQLAATRMTGFTSAPLRMTGFTLAASQDGVALGGHDVQAAVMVFFVCGAVCEKGGAATSPGIDEPMPMRRNLRLGRGREGRGD
jgi:hypothetical protein